MAALALREAATSRNAIRALIEAVVVQAGNSRGGKVRQLELHGDLFAMLEFAEFAAIGQNQALKNDNSPGPEGLGLYVLRHWLRG